MPHDTHTYFDETAARPELTELEQRLRARANDVVLMSGGNSDQIDAALLLQAADALAAQASALDAEHEAYELAASDAYRLKDELASARATLGELAEKYNALVDKEVELIENIALAEEETTMAHDIGRTAQTRAGTAEATMQQVAQEMTTWGQRSGGRPPLLSQVEEWVRILKGGQ